MVTQSLGEVIGPLVALLVLAAAVVWMPFATLGIGVVWAYRRLTP